jgi:prepilin-type processing-associated H-X9-DG protein
MRARQSHDRRTAFSLPELVIVLGMIGLLIAFLLPAVQRARESASKTRCQGNLKQIGLALHQYNDSQGVLPPAEADLRLPARAQPAGLRWMVLLLPYLGQQPVWDTTVRAYQSDPIPYHNPPHVGLATEIPQYTCPSDARLGVPLTDQDNITATFVSYLGVAGGWGGPYAFPTGPGRQDYGVISEYDEVDLANISDGTSNTLMVGERPPPATLQAGWWYSALEPSGSAYGSAKGPDGELFVAYGAGHIYGTGCSGPFNYGPGQLDNPCDRWHFWSLHENGGNWLFADGSVRFLSYSAGPIMIALATRAGGEITNTPEY